MFIVPGALLGITGGYLYYYFYGCANGCPINSNPYISMLWGGLMGYLLSDLVWDKVKQTRVAPKNEEDEA